MDILQPNPPETPQEPGFPDLFPPSPDLQVCSESSCASGHTWRPTLALTPCTGCQAQMLVLKRTNCPICNEPVYRTRLRMDHLAPGMGLTQVCRGVKGLAESMQLDLQHDMESPSV